MYNNIRVLLLCGPGSSSNIIYNALAVKEHIEVVGVVIEKKQSTKLMLKRRIKRLGVLKVFGQVIFIGIAKLNQMIRQKRIAELILQLGLDRTEIPHHVISKVKTVNSESAKEIVKSQNYDAVIVNGTRIINKSQLKASQAPMINIHMGITPKYRGVHGGYWALANDDTSNCGVTVHLIDQGIDTGDVLYQDRISPTSKDNFNTYPIRQMAAAIPLLIRALEDIKMNTLEPKDIDLPSKLWYHPTLWGYLATRIMRGVK